MSPSGYKENFYCYVNGEEIVREEEPRAERPYAMALLTALIPGAFSTAYHQRKHDPA
jgi:hypothetical protein